MTPTSGPRPSGVPAPNPEVQRTDTAAASTKPLRLAAIGPAFKSTVRPRQDQLALNSPQGAAESTPKAKKPLIKPTNQLAGKLIFTPAVVTGPPKRGGVTSPKELNPLSLDATVQRDSLLDRAPRPGQQGTDNPLKPRNGPIQWRALQNTDANKTKGTEHAQAQVTTLLSALSQRPLSKPNNLGAKPFRNKVAALANARRAEADEGRSALPGLNPRPNVGDFKAERGGRKVSEPQRGSIGPRPSPKIVVGGQ